MQNLQNILFFADTGICCENSQGLGPGIQQQDV